MYDVCTIGGNAMCKRKTRRASLVVGLQTMVLALGCGGSEGRAIDQNSAPLVASTDGSGVSLDLHHHADDHVNSLSYGIAQADFVGHVVVSRVEGKLGTTGRAARPAIWSKVEFKVLYAVKDHGVSSDARFALDFLGGQLGPKEMHVDHVPRFAEGDELILIARSSEKPCPSFAGEYGVLRVRDGQVLTYSGHTLRDINENGYIVAPPRAHAPTAPAPVPIGAASGRLVAPPVAEEGENLDVGNALARLSAIVNSGV